MSLIKKHITKVRLEVSKRNDLEGGSRGLNIFEDLFMTQYELLGLNRTGCDCVYKEVPLTLQQAPLISIYTINYFEVGLL